VGPTPDVSDIASGIIRVVPELHRVARLGRRLEQELLRRGTDQLASRGRELDLHLRDRVPTTGADLENNTVRDRLLRSQSCVLTTPDPARNPKTADATIPATAVTHRRVDRPGEERTDSWKPG
jgi:hypothetical protein